MPDSKMSEKTWIPLGLAVMCLTSAIGATWWLSGKMHNIESGQEANSRQLARIENTIANSGRVMEIQLANISGKMFERKSFEQWVESLRMGNPEIKTPTVK